MSARPVGAWFLGVAAAAVVGTVVAAIAVIGPPSQQREQRFDERRVQSLAQIESAVESYRTSRRELPATLDALKASPHGASLRMVDPGGGTPFQYRTLDTSRYELCADFSTAQEHGDGQSAFMGAEWAHPSGPHCFEREVERLPDDAAATGD